MYGLTKNYDMVIIGAGPAGIFSAYESILLNPTLKIAIIEQGLPLEKRFCPISKGSQKCINCKSCSIMSGFGGAGAFSDGKYNITNNFGGDLYNYVGKEKSIELMEYVDNINLSFGGKNSKMYSTENSGIKKLALQHGLNLLEARVRHLGTDINFVVLSNMYEYLKEHLDFYFNEEVTDISVTKEGFLINTSNDLSFESPIVIVAAGRSGSKWISTICSKLNIPTKSNKVDIGVRIELPYEIFEHITNDTHECKLVFKTKQYSDLVRTFCMNPHGIVTAENTHGIVTANGHSYSDPSKYTSNTNFALLVSNQFTEPFEDSNEYGESIAKFSNLLGGGLLVQQFGDLIKGRRSTPKRMQKCFTTPTLTAAAPGDLSLVLPKRHLDNIIETIYALDKIAPGTANDSTLLYGVEVKFYNSEVEVNNNLETPINNLYVIGDCSGVTHSLSHASASGIHVARHLFE
ncbi:MAG: NAD(P)/FAD-dependent oxidoreductase [Clostridia bacterium]|nr:NAD(P)/FAD-dependent oxidoreductase [Clostridia bacterium]MDD4376188.1 NAD(P)/FAD-dependent oxidoreductase [Clostridia bacterium]